MTGIDPRVTAAFERAAGNLNRLVSIKGWSHGLVHWLVSPGATLTGLLWIAAAAIFPREPAAPLWLMAPAAAASTIVLHRISVGDATAFFGWAAAAVSAVGLTLVAAGLLGQAAGMPADLVMFPGEDETVIAFGQPRH